MPLLLSLMPVIVKVAFWILETFFLNSAQDKESRRIFLDLAERLRSAGIKNVKSRFESEAQIEAGDKVWSEREKPPSVH